MGARRNYEFSDTVADRARMRQWGNCAHCGNSLDDLEEHAHHVVPNQAGRPSEPADAWLRTEENCVVLCDLCHEIVHGGNTATGGVARATFYPRSHGADDGGHKTWAGRVERQADDLYRRKNSNSKPRPRAFSAGRFSACAAGLGMFMKWVEQRNMTQAAAAAWDEFLNREGEAWQLMNDQPLFPVLIRMHFRYRPGLTEFMPDDYFFEGLDIESLAGGYSGYIGPLGPRDEYFSYHYIIDAVNAGGSDPSVRRGKGPPPQDNNPAWYSGFRAVQSALDAGDDYTKAAQILNASPMYDILRILDKMYQENRGFRLLENKYMDVGGIWNGRLKAAFWAIRLSRNSGQAFANYKVSCKEYANLPGDQQHDIEVFLLGETDTAPEPTTPAGEWHVKVGKYFWVYKFDQKGAVTWRDPYNGMNGRGKWKETNGKITIDWSPSKSRDTWNLPLDPKKQSGAAYVDGEGTFQFSATKV